MAEEPDVTPYANLPTTAEKIERLHEWAKKVTELTDPDGTQFPKGYL